MGKILTRSWRFRASREDSASACREIEEAAHEYGLESQTALKLNLIIEELFLNTVTHGNQDGGSTAVEISLTKDGARTSLTYCDKGPAFDPLQHEAGDVTDPDRAGGRGILLVKGFVVNSRYERDEGWNRLHLDL